jgi:glutathione S-transferase
MLRIWGRKTSSNVMKVLWLCEELAIPFERIDAGGAFGVTQEPAYLAKNPNALVPTIEEPDGFALWESNTILRYLARSRAAGHPICPSAPREAADVERWMDWQLSALNGAMTPIFFTYVRTPEPQRDYAAAEKARQAAAKLWAMVEPRLARQDFICGPHLTLADVALGVYVHRWFVLPIERPAMPGLVAWYERLKARPGYAKHCTAPLS